MYQNQEIVCQKYFEGIFSRASEDRVTEGRGEMTFLGFSWSDPVLHKDVFILQIFMVL